MRMKPKVHLLSLLFMALPLVAMAGCGSSSSDSASAAEPLSKAGFVSQADASCERAEKAKARSVEQVFGSVVREGTTSKHKLEMAIAKEVIPLYRGLVSELARLNPPVKDEAQVARLVAAWKAALKRAEANLGALINKDPFQTAND